MNNFLKIIHETTKERVSNIKASYDELQDAAMSARIPHDFLATFKNNIAIIAEIKFASPTRGEFSYSKDPIEIATHYVENGASAISVLTESTYFKGSLNYLECIRDRFPSARLLMKDFILDEKQLLQARILGADAILLIAAFLSREELTTLYQKATALKLTPLVEVHTFKELQLAESVGAKLIGVNNRNLATLTIDLSISRKLIAKKTTSAIMISESGFGNHEQINQFYQLGYQGFLVGSQLMSAQNPGLALRRLLQNES